MAIQRSWSGKRLVLNTARTTITTVLIASILGACSQSGAPEKSGNTQEAEAPLTADVVKRLFTTKCAICHGENGKMQYAGAKDLTLSTMTEAEIAAQIKYGKGSMPPQQGVLKDHEIEALAKYTLQLPK